VLDAVVIEQIELGASFIWLSSLKVTFSFFEWSVITDAFFFFLLVVAGGGVPK